MNVRTYSVSPLGSSTDVSRVHDPQDDSAGSRGSRTTAGQEVAVPKPIVAKWVPYTLRRDCIWIPTVLSLAFGLTVILLLWYSKRNSGLSPELTALFGWKFVPTLLAVVYTQSTVMLFDDVKRTEPFARLARPHAEAITPSALSTILETPRQWWTTLAHGFYKQRNGGRRGWVVILCCVVNVLAFLAISPLSSALLGIDNVNIAKTIEMVRLTPNDTSMLPISAERTTYLRTMGALLQDLTTSAWISDEYFIMPFWPAGTDGLPWDQKTAATAQTWQAETQVFRSDLHCERMDKVDQGFAVSNWTLATGAIVPSRSWVLMQSAGGCKLNLTSQSIEAVISAPFAHWGNANSLAIKNKLAQLELPPILSEQCQGDESILLSSPWTAGFDDELLSNLTMTGYICSTGHTMATLPVTASVSTSQFFVDFDQDEFQTKQRAVPRSLFNISQLHDLYTDPKWWSYVPTFQTQNLNGAAALLATQYEFNLTAMMNDADIVQKASRIRRRFFGEVLRTSLSSQGTTREERVIGMTSFVQRRVTVSPEAAYVLSTLFLGSFVMLLFVTWLSITRWRPLNLAHDPASVLGIASLVASNPGVLAPFKDLDQTCKQDMVVALRDRYYTTSPGELHEVQKPGTNLIRPKNGTFGMSKWKPFTARRRTLFGFAMYLVVLIAAITVLYRFASRSTLHQSIFTYRTNIGQLGRLGAFAPFSIIPTLLAVILGLWWDGMDKSYRSLQPFVSMSKAPTRNSTGAGISYQSSYWLWASWKAATNKHWLLALMTSGTFLAQAFIISMSALFERETGLVLQSVELNRNLELRQTPHLRQISTAYPPYQIDTQRIWGIGYVEHTLSELFGNLSTNWMYSATIEATLNGPGPDWSKDDWSFTPLDISTLPSIKSVQDGDVSEFEDVAVLNSPVNITLHTPAIRGRLECTPSVELSNESSWVEKNNVTAYFAPNFNRNVSTYYLLSGTIRPQLNGTQMPNLDYTTFLTPAATLIECCFNQTEADRIADYTMPVAVGYWTINRATNINTITQWTGNFTAKWIHGSAGFAYLANPVEKNLFFLEPPKRQSLNCMPVIETAEAQVTVEKGTGRVLDYALLTEVERADAPWSDSFTVHNVSDNAIIKSYTEAEAGLQNITSSYGVLFIHSLLSAASLNTLNQRGSHGPAAWTDNFEDMVFNIRDNQTGLNLDFMSYASYVQTGSDPSALLNETTLLKQTQKMFSLFFQHFVSSTVSLKTGGWAYQPIGTNLDGLGPPASNTLLQLVPGNETLRKSSDFRFAPLNTSRVTTATLSARVEILRMNPIAFWVSVSILVWLTATTAVVAALQKRHLGNLIRNVESVADVLVLIAGSRKLLQLVQERGVEGLEKADVYTKLGYFVGEGGRVRWGIEVVEPPTTGNVGPTGG